MAYARIEGTITSTNLEASAAVNNAHSAGARFVESLNDLYSIKTALLSPSYNISTQVANEDNDAIGQLWYVQEEDKYYILKDWENRDKPNGWAVYADNILDSLQINGIKPFNGVVNLDRLHVDFESGYTTAVGLAKNKKIPALNSINGITSLHDTFYSASFYSNNIVRFKASDTDRTEIPTPFDCIGFVENANNTIFYGTYSYNNQTEYKYDDHGIIWRLDKNTDTFVKSDNFGDIDDPTSPINTVALRNVTIENVNGNIIEKELTDKERLALLNRLGTLSSIAYNPIINRYVVTNCWGCGIFWSDDSEHWSGAESINAIVQKPEDAPYDGDNRCNGAFNRVISYKNMFIAASGATGATLWDRRGVWYSEDGKNWYQGEIDDPYFTNIECQAYGLATDGNIIVAGTLHKNENGDGLLYSEDGKTWRRSNIREFGFEHIFYIESIKCFYAPSYSGLMYVSYDGKTWAPISEKNVNWVDGCENSLGQAAFVTKDGIERPFFYITEHPSYKLAPLFEVEPALDLVKNIDKTYKTSNIEYNRTNTSNTLVCRAFKYIINNNGLESDDIPDTIKINSIVLTTQDITSSTEYSEPFYIHVYKKLSSETDWSFVGVSNGSNAFTAIGQNQIWNFNNILVNKTDELLFVFKNTIAEHTDVNEQTVVRSITKSSSIITGDIVYQYIIDSVNSNNISERLNIPWAPVESLNKSSIESTTSNTTILVSGSQPLLESYNFSFNIDLTRANTNTFTLWTTVSTADGCRLQYVHSNDIENRQFRILAPNSDVLGEWTGPVNSNDTVKIIFLALTKTNSASASDTGNGVFIIKLNDNIIITANVNNRLKTCLTTTSKIFTAGSILFKNVSLMSGPAEKLEIAAASTINFSYDTLTDISIYGVNVSGAEYRDGGVTLDTNQTITGVKTFERGLVMHDVNADRGITFKTDTEPLAQNCGIIYGNGVELNAYDQSRRIEYENSLNIQSLAYTWIRAGAPETTNPQTKAYELGFTNGIYLSCASELADSGMSNGYVKVETKNFKVFNLDSIFNKPISLATGAEAKELKHVPTYNQLLKRTIGPGLKVVDTKSDLYSIPDSELSMMWNYDHTSTGTDALGQEWYVKDEARYYRLVNWEERHSIAGWDFSDQFDLVDGIDVTDVVDSTPTKELTIGRTDVDSNKSNGIQGIVLRPYYMDLNVGENNDIEPDTYNITSFSLTSRPDNTIISTSIIPHFWIATSSILDNWNQLSLIGSGKVAQGFTSNSQTLTWDCETINVRRDSMIVVTFNNVEAGTVLENANTNLVGEAVTVRRTNVDEAGIAIHTSITDGDITSSTTSSHNLTWVPACSLTISTNITYRTFELPVNSQATTDNSLQSRKQITNLIDTKVDAKVDPIVENINTALNGKQNTITTGRGLTFDSSDGKLRLFNTTNCSGFEFGDDDAVRVNVYNFTNDTSQLPSLAETSKVVFDESGQLSVYNATTEKLGVVKLTPAPASTDPYEYSDIEIVSYGNSGTVPNFKAVHTLANQIAESVSTEQISTALNGKTLWTGTQSEYDALVAAGTISDSTIYFIVA